MADDYDIVYEGTPGLEFRYSRLKFPVWTLAYAEMIGFQGSTDTCIQTSPENLEPMIDKN